MKTERDLQKLIVIFSDKVKISTVDKGFCIKYQDVIEIYHGFIVNSYQSFTVCLSKLC